MNLKSLNLKWVLAFAGAAAGAVAGAPRSPTATRVRVSPPRRVLTGMVQSVQIHPSVAHNTSGGLPNDGSY